MFVTKMIASFHFNDNEPQNQTLVIKKIYIEETYIKDSVLLQYRSSNNKTK